MYLAREIKQYFTVFYDDNKTYAYLCITHEDGVAEEYMFDCGIINKEYLCKRIDYAPNPYAYLSRYCKQVSYSNNYVGECKALQRNIVKVNNIHFIFGNYEDGNYDWYIEISGNKYKVYSKHKLVYQTTI